MDVGELMTQLSDWLASEPVVRGYRVYDAELRLRLDGTGRVAVALNPKNPEAEFRAAGEHLEEMLRRSDAKRRGEPVGELPPPPRFPDRAFADFVGLAELEELLLGEKPAAFYFDDESKSDLDPLKR
ncbi:MAG: hypothetical protein C0501_17535 [Isosphaera sp.]|nr:hypothetical protein [Isosphaera sp.]